MAKVYAVSLKDHFTYLRYMKLKLVSLCPRRLPQEELLERVVVPYLLTIDADRSVDVRRRAALLLLDVLMTCTSPSVVDVVQILRKVCVSTAAHVSQCLE